MENKQKKTIDKLVELELEGISIEIKKPKKLIYVTLLTDNYKLKITASKNQFWIDNYQQS